MRPLPAQLQLQGMQQLTSAALLLRRQCCRRFIVGHGSLQHLKVWQRAPARQVCLSIPALAQSPGEATLRYAGGGPGSLQSLAHP